MGYINISLPKIFICNGKSIDIDIDGINPKDLKIYKLRFLNEHKNDLDGESYINFRQVGDEVFFVYGKNRYRVTLVTDNKITVWGNSTEYCLDLLNSFF